MNISLTMEYVLLRASQEASAFSGGNMGLEHIFLGILKVPEVKGADVVKDRSRREEFDKEAAEVAEIARKAAYGLEKWSESKEFSELSNAGRIKSMCALGIEGMAEL